PGNVNALFVFGHRAADDHVFDPLGLDLSHLCEDALQDVREQRVRAGVLERAARRLAYRCTRRRNDIRVMHLPGHVTLPSISQWLASLERVGDALLRL